MKCNSRRFKISIDILSLLFSVIASFFVFIFVIFYVNDADKWVIISKIPPVLRHAGRGGLKFLYNLPYFKYNFKKHGLPVYDIKIDRKTLRELRTNLPKPTEQLTDKYKRYKSAKFIYDGKEYNVRIKQRGVSRNHWLWDKKSMRVQFDDDLFEGIKNLNFIVPIDRVYLVEEFNHYRARRLGLDVPRSYFSVVKINGKDPAVYWVVEHYDKEMLETARLSSDANLYGESDMYVNNHSFKNLYASVYNFKKYNTDVRYNKKNYAEIRLLMHLINDAARKEFEDNIFSLVDKDNFYSWSIHNLLAFGQHQDWKHNIRLYFDPSLGKFKFIPVDVSMGSLKSDITSEDFFEEHSNILINKILSNSVFMEERNFRLWKYLNDENNLKEELEYYDNLYESVKTAFYQDKVKRFTNRYFDDMVAKYRNRIIENSQILKNKFARVNLRVKAEYAESGIKLNIFTKSLSPLVLRKVEIIDNAGKVVYFKDNIGLNIQPNIKYVQLPSPSEIYPVINDFYKAFGISDKVSVYTLDVGDLEDKDNFKIKVYIKNIYTNQISDFTLYK